MAFSHISGNLSSITRHLNMKLSPVSLCHFLLFRLLISDLCWKQAVFVLDVSESGNDSTA